MAGRPHCATCRTAIVAKSGGVCLDCAPAPVVVAPEPVKPAPSRIRALWAFRVRLADGFVHAVRFGAIYEGERAAELVKASPQAFAVLA